MRGIFRNDSDDDEADRVTHFLAWLKDNGAIWDKLKWPCVNKNGVRCVNSVCTISPEEFMLQVPSSCMLSQNQAMKLQDIGEIFVQEQNDLLRGDHGLVVFIMHEIIKGQESFFFPYLSILSEPYTLENWSEIDMDELQDENLVILAKRRARQKAHMWENMIGTLCDTYPMFFRREMYTLNLYKTAWGLVCTRAFGRFLPYSALVPLADCLNHGNVATKYDFDTDENGMFRLWSTGNYDIGPGCEVLNSYGQRGNDHLLLEYGFSILDNCWEEVAIPLNSMLTSRLKYNTWPESLILFYKSQVVSEDFFYTGESDENAIKLKPSSLSNELTVLKLALQCVTNVIVEYPTSLEQDEVLLNSVGSSSKLCYALMYRITLKRILQSISEKLKEAINSMS